MKDLHRLTPAETLMPDKDCGMSDLLFPVWVTADMFDVPVRESETSTDPDITLCFIRSVLGFLHKTSNSRDETSGMSPNLFIFFSPSFFFSSQ